MSLYNMVHGENKKSDLWLAMLGLSREDFGRYRDCYLSEIEGELRIVVHTRCGGGNREEYEYVFEQMAEHPEYISNHDDDFDCTYADIIFAVPKQHLWEIFQHKDRLTDNRTPTEKWNSAIESLKGMTPEEIGKKNPELKALMDQVAAVIGLEKK